MFGSTILDTAIGLAFVFLLLSLIATALREALEVWLKSRAAHLERGIRALLHDPEGTGLARAFYGHPLVRSLYGASAPGEGSQPRRSFARVSTAASAPGIALRQHNYRTVAERLRAGAAPFSASSSRSRASSSKRSS